MTPYVKQIFILLFQRLTSSKTTKYVKGMYVDDRVMGYIIVDYAIYLRLKSFEISVHVHLRLINLSQCYELHTAL